MVKEYTCVVCSKKFKGFSHQEKHGRNKNCSLECNGKARKKHGMSQSVLYRKFKSVQQRCLYKKSKHYASYGGRGIKCLWKTFEKFRDDMQESYDSHVLEHGRLNTTLDRIDNNGNYCKENCRWLTVREQCHNKTNNVVLEIDNKKMFLSEIAIKFNLKLSTIRTRYARGCTVSEIIRPARTYGS